MSDHATYITIKGDAEGNLEEMDFFGIDTKLFNLLLAAAAADDHLQELISKAALFMQDYPDKYEEFKKYVRSTGEPGHETQVWNFQLN